MEPGAWAPAELEALRKHHFDGVASDDPALLRFAYEHHQPPLYYLLAAVVWRLAPQPELVKLLNLGLSCLVLCLPLALARTRGWEDGWHVLLATVILALSPMRCFMAVSIGNGVLAELIFGVYTVAIAAGCPPHWSASSSASALSPRSPCCWRSHSTCCGCVWRTEIARGAKFSAPAPSPPASRWRSCCPGSATISQPTDRRTCSRSEPAPSARTWKRPPHWEPKGPSSPCWESTASKSFPGGSSPAGGAPSDGWRSSPTRDSFRSTSG